MTSGKTKTAAEGAKTGVIQRANNAEVDYVIALSGKIIPIEIKAGATGSLKSLHQFIAEKNLILPFSLT